MSLDLHLGLCCDLRAALHLGNVSMSRLHAAEATTASRTISGSVVLQQPGSVMVSSACVATKDYMGAQILN